MFYLIICCAAAHGYRICLGWLGGVQVTTIINWTVIIMLNVIKGPLPRAKKYVIYGCEGIGKTTLAAQIPSVVFIDTEDGTSFMDVARLPKPNSWDNLVATVNAVAYDPKPGVDTLAIDTADAAERLCEDHVCKKFGKPTIESFGYGRGYVELANEYSKLLQLLDQLIYRNINVVLIAHAKMRKFELPEQAGTYDRWELKLTKNVAPIVKEWSDDLLFLNYRTQIVKVDSHAKAFGGERVIYTSHHACWDAKSRSGLPEVMPLDINSASKIFNFSK